MLKKIMTALLTLLVSLVLVFFIVQAMPGNPVDALTRQYMTGNQLPYDIAYERAKAALNYNPDIPVMQRFFAYVGGMLSGNLGQSMSYKESVSTIVLGALPWTLLVCSISLLLSFVVGNFLGLFVAWKRSKVMDSVLTGYQAIFGSIPDYIVAYLIIAVFSVALGWFPSRGAYSSDVVPGWNFPFILDVLYHASLPILSYFVTTVAAWVIGMKAICMGILGEDYINYATCSRSFEKSNFDDLLGPECTAAADNRFGDYFRLYVRWCAVDRKSVCLSWRWILSQFGDWEKGLSVDARHVSDDHRDGVGVRHCR